LVGSALLKEGLPMAWLKREFLWWGLCGLILVLILLTVPVSYAPWYHPSEKSAPTSGYWAQITKVATDGSAVEVRKIPDENQKNKDEPTETLRDSALKASLATSSGLRFGHLPP
jgi:hypothetical protein